MLVRFNELVKEIRQDYDQYNFIEIYKALMNYIITDLPRSTRLCEGRRLY